LPVQKNTSFIDVELTSQSLIVHVIFLSKFKIKNVKKRAPL